MQQVATSVLARRIVIDAPYATLPYEAGWAREAVAFVQAEGDHPDLALATEISPDGIAWIRRGQMVTLGKNQSIAELPLTTFGNWVRIVVDGATVKATAQILIHLVMKG